MISVIIPTCNRPHLIYNSVASVVGQTYEDVEIIVVDGSVDSKTKEIVDKFNDKRIVCLKIKNESAAASRNIGMKEAKGEFIAFNDDDDVWAKDKLERQVSLLGNTTDQNVIVYSSFSKIINNKVRIIPSGGIEKKTGSLYSELLFCNFIGLPTVLVPASCCKNVLFDQKLKCLEDWDWFIRLSKKNNFLYIDKPLVSAGNTQSSVNKSDYHLKIFAYKYIYNKYYAYIIKSSRVQAKHLLSIGSNLCLSGNLHEGRDYLFQSLKIGPNKTKAIVAYILSHFGRYVFCSSFRFFEKLTFRQP